MWAGARRGRPPGRRGTDPFVVLLVAQLVQKIVELPWKPPVTLLVMAVNTLLYFKRELLPYELVDIIPSIRDGCLEPRAVIQYGEWSRLIWSAFLHLDDMHLYYNMTSLLIKGVQLERQLGSVRFAGLLGELLLLSHGTMAVVVMWLSESYPTYRQMGITCSAGFSAVLFALKYVLTHNQPGLSHPMGIGIPVPTKYISWAELFLIHYLVPGSSFTGHLAGIAAGMMHVHVLSPLWLRLWRTVRAMRRMTRQGLQYDSWSGRGAGRTASRSTSAGGGTSAGGVGRSSPSSQAHRRPSYGASGDERGRWGPGATGSEGGGDAGWMHAEAPAPPPAVTVQPTAPPAPAAPQPTAPPLPSAVTAAALAAERRLRSAAAADARFASGVQRGPPNMRR